MMNRKNRNPPKIGEIFSRLTVLEKTTTVGGQNRNWRYKCLCECGNTAIVVGSSLRSKSTRSCGCLRSEILSKPPGEAAWNKLFTAYKRDAFRRNLLFNLTLSDLKFFVVQDCYYCGASPIKWNPYKSEGKKDLRKAAIERATIEVNGIDRLDNNLGYTLQNCRPCCTICNKMKLYYSEKFFLNHVSKISAFQKEYYE